MDSSGSVKYLSTIEIPTVKIQCNGITYDESAGITTLLLSTPANGLKSSLFKDATVIDQLLYQINDANSIVRAKHITFAKTGSLYSTNLETNLLHYVDGYYIWAGVTRGYTTDYQSAKFTNDKSNAFVMRYLYDTTNAQRCIRD